MVNNSYIMVPHKREEKLTSPVVHECEHWGLLCTNVVLCVRELDSELTQD